MKVLLKMESVFLFFQGKLKQLFIEPFSNIFLFVSCKELDVTLTDWDNIAFIGKHEPMNIIRTAFDYRVKSFFNTFREDVNF